MLSWAVLIACAVLMYRIAEQGGRSGPIWGVLTGVICFLCGIIPLPLLNYVIGLTISYGILIVVSIVQKPRP